MAAVPQPAPSVSGGPRSPAAIVDEFLRLIMIPDPTAARRFTAHGMRIRFTGGREMSDPKKRVKSQETRVKKSEGEPTRRLNKDDPANGRGRR